MAYKSFSIVGIYIKEKKFYSGQAHANDTLSFTYSNVEYLIQFVILLSLLNNFIIINDNYFLLKKFNKKKIF